MSVAGKVLLGALGVFVILKTFWPKKRVHQPTAPVCSPEKHEQPDAPVRYGCFSDKGSRGYMEDFHYAATEGQKGFFVVDAFLKVDQLFQKEVATGRQQPSGTTALAAVVLPKRVIVANAGDCRCILSRSGVARDVTEEHSPQSPTEKTRIQAAGGFLDEDGYLCGQLGVSRAIGDHHLQDLKHPGGSGPLIADPEVTEVAIGEQDEFMVLASDGLWMMSQAVVNIIRTSLRTHNCPALAAEEVAKAAINDPTSRDNITVTVICFKKIPPPQRAAGRNNNSRLRINRN